jgi:carbonic anhydrase/acetyltransferase-like protein (isoleucine patch superfamily)
MKTIYLWVNGEGWKSFDFDAPETKQALIDRHITIGDYAEIGNYAEIGDSAKIGYYAEIGDSAKIGYYAEIGDSAKIGDKEIILKTLFITGTKHTVTWWGKGIIDIGCHKKEISWWLKNGVAVAEREGYSPEQIEEYRQYVIICDMLQKLIK